MSTHENAWLRLSTAGQEAVDACIQRSLLCFPPNCQPVLYRECQLTLTHQTKCSHPRPCIGTCPTGVCPPEGCLPGHFLAAAQINKKPFRTDCSGPLCAVVTSAFPPAGLKVSIVDSDALSRPWPEVTKEEIEECVQIEHGDKVPSLELGTQNGQYVILDSSCFRGGQVGQYSASLQNLKFKLNNNIGPKRNWALFAVVLGPANEELAYYLTNPWQIYDDRSSKAVKVKGQDVNSATLIANISGFGREGRSFVRDPEAFLTEQGCDLDDVALFGSHVKNPRDAEGLERFAKVFDGLIKRLQARGHGRKEFQAILNRSCLTPGNALRWLLSSMKWPDKLLRLCSLTIGEHKWHVVFTQFFPIADFASVPPYALALEVGSTVELRPWCGWGLAPAEKEHIISEASQKFCLPDHAGLWRTTVIRSEGGQLFAIAGRLGEVFSNCIRMDLGVFNSLMELAPDADAVAWTDLQLL